MKPETARALWETLGRAAKGYAAHVARRRKEAADNPPPVEIPELEVAPEAIDLLEAQVTTSAQLVDVTVDAISAVESAKAETRALRKEIEGLRADLSESRESTDDLADIMDKLLEQTEKA